MMKRLLLMLACCVFYWNTNAQITIMDNTPEIVEKIAKYDSLTNFKRMPYTSPEQEKYGSYTFHHLIGQTVMYCGEPYSYYSAPSLKVGEYYKILDILPNIRESGKYDRLKLMNIKDSSIVNVGDIGAYQKYNYQLVVLGHYEKIKKTYLGKKFIYTGYVAVPSGYDKEDHLINVSADTVNYNINKQSIWECIDVQVKPRKKDDRMSIDYRSPIVLVMQNEKHGKYYCYLESQYGNAFETYSDDLPIVGPCFREKEMVDAYKRAQEQAKKQRWDTMISKYGNTYGTLVAQGKVRIGMTSEMCRDAWGAPNDINKTTGSWGVHEQWVYSGDSYLYFEDGVLTSIQN